MRWCPESVGLTWHNCGPVSLHRRPLLQYDQHQTKSAQGLHSLMRGREGPEGCGPLGLTASEDPRHPRPSRCFVSSQENNLTYTALARAHARVRPRSGWQRGKGQLLYRRGDRLEASTIGPNRAAAGAYHWPLKEHAANREQTYIGGTLNETRPAVASAASPAASPAHGRMLGGGERRI